MHFLLSNYKHSQLVFIIFQVIYWLGAVGGAALSAYLSGSWGLGVGVRPWMGFVGGVIMLFGARLASGCTR